MWGFLAAFLAANGAANTVRRIEKENKKLVVCLACEAEMPKGARCCRVCGSRDLMAKPKFLDLQEEAAIIRMRYESEQAALHQRHFDAKRAYDRARTLRRCPDCFTIYRPEEHFCMHCSLRTHRVTEDQAREIILSRYNDIIQTDDDFARIDAIDLAEEETLADVAVSLTKSAVKATFRTGWRGTKFVLRKFLE
jgi:ribosomal protein L40E